MNKKYLLALACAGALIYAVQASANQDHQQISGPFNSPMEVTRKCLECHEDAAHDVMQTSHWTWKLAQDLDRQGKVDRGKMNTINNFCI